MRWPIVFFTHALVEEQLNFAATHTFAHCTFALFLLQHPFSLVQLHAVDRVETISKPTFVISKPPLPTYCPLCPAAPLDINIKRL